MLLVNVELGTSAGSADDNSPDDVSIYDVTSASTSAFDYNGLTGVQCSTTTLLCE